MIGHPLKVRELLDEISKGQVQLPEIQRAYVWKGPQVAKLLDSLYQEYPAGQILLWDTGTLPIMKNLTGVVTPTLPVTGQPKIVLDGQQRLTSLWKALGESSEAESVDVWFNLEGEYFERYNKKMGGDPFWVGVRDVLNGKVHDIDVIERLIDSGRLTPKDDRRKTYLDRLQRLKRIGEYKFPIEIFKSDDYERVTELFVRINASGTRLRAAELVLAQLALRLPGALVDKFEEAMDSYEDVGFALDTRFLVRALIAVGTGQARFKYLTEFWKHTPKEIDAIWERTRKGIDAAVNFTRQNALFESSELLPSLYPLIPLTSYFDRFNTVAPAAEKSLLRWLYVAMLRSRYTGGSETALDEDLKAVQSQEPVEGLLRNALPPGVSATVAPEEFDDAGTRSPLFALTYAAIRRNNAKDWFTGVGLNTDVVGGDHAIEIHHIFPKARLKELGASRKDRDEIANLAFLGARPNKKISATPPTTYLAELAKEHPERLKAQFIPMDPKLWELERFQDFLASRREALAEAVNLLVQ